MGNQTKWGAKRALACYLALIGGVIVASLLIGAILSSMNLDIMNLPYPYALLSVPINEATFLGITLLFAGFSRLGFKKLDPKTAVWVSAAAVLLIFLAGAIAAIETTVFGPDPLTEQLSQAIVPKDLIQLVLLIALNLVLVGPVEELTFRGYIQQGLQNSLGKPAGLLVAALLFGLIHSLNSPYSVLPVFAVGLVLGYVWQRTGGNTTATALMHGMYNTIQFILIYFVPV